MAKLKCQNFPKSAEKRLFWPVFFSSKICLRRRKFGQNRVFTVICESSENQFGRPKKRSRQNFQSTSFSVHAIWQKKTQKTVFIEFEVCRFVNFQN